MTRLRGLTWRHPRGVSPLRATAAAYALLHPDTTIQWDDLPWHQFWQVSVNEMRGHSGCYDLYLFDHPWVGELAENGWRIPLDIFLSTEQRADLEADADPASYQSYVWGKQAWGLPVDAACHVLVFHPDLVESATLPTDWDELLELARTRRRPPHRYAFTAPWSGGSNALLFFLAILAATSERPFEDPARPTITPERGRRALEILRQVWEMSLPAERVAVGRGVYEVLLETDQAAIAVSVFAYINYFGSGAAHRLGIADVPVLPETGARTSLLGGMGLGISADCSAPHRAWEYAGYVMSKPVEGGLYVDHGGQPGRLSALGDRVIEARTGSFCPTLRRALHGCYIRPRYPRWLEIVNGGAPALERFLAGAASADQTLHALHTRAQTL